MDSFPATPSTWFKCIDSQIDLTALTCYSDYPFNCTSNYVVENWGRMFLSLLVVLDKKYTFNVPNEAIKKLAIIRPFFFL